jgi:hypothetical protein
VVEPATTSVVKQDIEINEVIDITLQKAIILVPAINDEQRLMVVVNRPDILRQNLNEKFLTIWDAKHTFYS